MPPTPPPDIDIETWEESLDIVAALVAERLALTHFGAVEDDVPGHIEQVAAKLREEAELARRMEKEEYNAAPSSAGSAPRLDDEELQGDTVEELIAGGSHRLPVGAASTATGAKRRSASPRRVEGLLPRIGPL